MYRYTAGTPNGQKISCTLEELGIKYNVHKIDISKNEQKQDWFLEINRTSSSLPPSHHNSQSITRSTQLT